MLVSFVVVLGIISMVVKIMHKNYEFIFSIVVTAIADLIVLIVALVFKIIEKLKNR